MEQVSLDEISIDLFTSTETTPEEELISQEGIHRLNLAIDSLPAKCKMAFKLVREDKLKYKEVAAILDISVKTLEAHLTNAVRKLRELLEKVVSEGSGKNAYLEGYSIGGKTATSQTLPPIENKFSHSRKFIFSEWEQMKIFYLFLISTKGILASQRLYI